MALVSMETADGLGTDYLNVTLGWWGYPSTHNLLRFDEGVFAERKSSLSI